MPRNRLLKLLNYLLEENKTRICFLLLVSRHLRLYKHEIIYLSTADSISRMMNEVEPFYIKKEDSYISKQIITNGFQVCKACYRKILLASM